MDKKIESQLQGQIDDLRQQIEALQTPQPVMQDNKFQDISFFPLLKVGKLFTGNSWTDVSSSRAVDTTYQNANYALMVMATFKCIVTVAGGNSYVQAKSDSSSPPTTVASGKVGIETGLLNENNTFQLVFIVNPGAYYKVTTAVTNGSVTLEQWMEIPF